MCSLAVLTAAPVEVALRPVLASAFVAWLRAVSAAICAAVVDALAAPVVAVFAVTVPASALVAWVPLTGPPALLMKIWSSVSGLCQYCGATSITT